MLPENIGHSYTVSSHVQLSLTQGGKVNCRVTQKRRHSRCRCDLLSRMEKFCVTRYKWLPQSDWNDTSVLNKGIIEKRQTENVKRGNEVNIGQEQKLSLFHKLTSKVLTTWKKKLILRTCQKRFFDENRAPKIINNVKHPF